MTKLLTTRWGVGINSVTGAARRGLCIGLLSALTLCTLAPQAQAQTYCTKSALGINGACLWVKADKGVANEGELLMTWGNQVDPNPGNAFFTNLTRVEPSNSPFLVKDPKDPKDLQEGLNFNPAVSFNGVDQAIGSGSGSTIGPDVSAISVFFVSREEGRKKDVSMFLHDKNKPSQVIAYWPNDEGKLYWRFGPNADDNRVSAGVLFHAGVPNLGLVTSNANDPGPKNLAIFVNAKELARGGTGVKINDPFGQTLNTTRVGSRQPGFEVYSGIIPELLEFNRELSRDERTRVQSYLALKYGLTLDRDGLAQQAYKSKSDDGSIVNVYTSAQGRYWNGIFGIGRDDDSGLDQRVSRSTQRLKKRPNGETTALVKSDPPLVVIATPNKDGTAPDFTSANGNPRTQLDDGQYLVLGDNDGSSTELTLATAGQRGRPLKRVWYAKNTGGVGPVHLGFNALDFKIDFFGVKPWLYVGKDPEFPLLKPPTKHPVEAVILSQNGPLFYTPVNNRVDKKPLAIQINDGDYLTLAQEFDQELACEGQAAGVTTGACLWLKADVGAGVGGSACGAAGIETWWEDQSKSDKHLGCHSNQGYNAPELIAGSATTGMNFNPVVRFDGKNQALTRDESTLGPNGDVINLFFVTRGSGNSAEMFTHTKVPKKSGNPELTLVWDRGRPVANSFWRNGDGGNVDNRDMTAQPYGTIPVGKDSPPHLGLVADSKTEAIGDIFVNAKKVTSPREPGSGSANTNTAASGLSVTRLGHGSQEPGYYAGDIAELIEFKSNLKPDERTRVQSYLALKYGLTLDRTELDGNAYKRSDGTSVYDNSNYWHRIFGLGNDSATGLNQRVAKSQEDGAVLTIATTAEFTKANNDDKRTPLPTAGQYLVLGDNGDGKPLTLDSTKRLQRRWFAQNTGVNSVYLGFDAAALDTIFPQDSSSYLEVVQEDNSSKKRYALGRVGGFLTPVDPVSGKPTPVTPIPDRAYIALGKACDGKALGIADACVWLKADTGVSAGSGWADQSGLHNDATATQTPTLVPNALNFNPVVSYSGGAGHTFSPDADVTTRYTFLGVARMENLNTDGPVFADALSQKLFGIEGKVQDRWSELPADSVGGHSGPVAASLFPRMHTLWRNDKDIKLRSNGAVIYNPSGLESGGAYRMTLASGGAWTRSADVSIPEFFSFNRPLGVSEINRIESYLALKYGLTLGTAVSYHSSGTATPGTIVWDGATGYPNRIFGLGRDSVTSLDQRVAKSQEDGAVLTITTTTANPDGSDTANFTSANSKSRTQLVADGQYLVLGDNGKPLTLDSTQRLQRVWRAQSTGGPIPVFLGLDAAALHSTNPAGKRMLWVEGGAGADAKTTPYELSNTPVTGYWVPVANNTAKAVTIPNGVSFLTYGVLSFPKISLSVKSTGGVGTFVLSSVDAATNGFKPSSATTKDPEVAVAAEPATQTLIKEGEVTITVTMPATNWSLESVSCTDATNPGSAVQLTPSGNQFTIDAAGVKMGSDLRCTLTTKYVAPIPPAQLPKLRLSVQSTGGVGTFGLSGDHNFGTDTATTAEQMVPIDLAEKTLDAVDVPVTITVAAVPPSANWSLDSVRCTANPEVQLPPKGNQFTIPDAHVKAGSNLHCTITTKYGPPAPGVILPKLSLSVQSTGGVGTFRFGGTNGFGEVTVITTAQGVAAPVTPVQKTLSKAGEDVRITVTMPATTGWRLESGSCTDATPPGGTVQLTPKDNQFIIPASQLPSAADLHCALVARYDSGSTLKTVSGRVFVDNGAGGGVANDGKINGGEAGRSGVALRLTNCNGTTHAATSSGGDGSYRLLVPSTVTGGDMCVEQTLSDDYRGTQGGVEASGVEASGVTLAANSAQRNRWRFNYTGADVRNLHIGNVPSSRLLLDGWGRGMVGDTVDFPHRFIAGTDGTLTFAVTDASSTTSGWGETLYRDVNCNAKFDAGEPLLGGSLTVKADENVCVIVRQFVPAGPYEGATRQFQLQATLKWDKVDVSEPLTNRDHTTVGAQPLRLYKQVRNVNTGEPWTTRNSAKPGEILEYCITFTNQAPEKIDDLVISGATPNYTTLVSAECPTNQPTTTVTTGCPDVLPAGMGCTVTKPVVGGTGSLRWQFTGPLRPRAEGAVTYQVKVNDK